MFWKKNKQESIQLEENLTLEKETLEKVLEETLIENMTEIEVESLKLENSDNDINLNTYTEEELNKLKEDLEFEYLLKVDELENNCKSKELILEEKEKNILELNLKNKKELDEEIKKTIIIFNEKILKEIDTLNKELEIISGKEINFEYLRDEFFRDFKHYTDNKFFELELEFQKKEKELEIEINSKLLEIESSWYELEIERENNIKELLLYREDTFKEYQKNKKEFEDYKKQEFLNLERFFNDKLNEIEIIKNKNLSEYNNNLNILALEKEQFINYKKTELENISNEKQLAFEELEKERIHFENEKLQELENLEFHKNSTIKNLNEEITREKSDWNETLNKEMEDLDKLREMTKQEMLDYKERVLAEIRTQEIELESSKNSFQKEVELQAVAERKQNLKDKKRQQNQDRFFPEGSLRNKLQKTFNSNRYIRWISYLLILVMIGNISFGFEYYLNPKKFIYSGLNVEKKYNSFTKKTIFYIDNMKEDSYFKRLKSTSLLIVNQQNKKLNESYNKFSLREGKTEYVWERFHRGELSVSKTPYESQYIILEKYKEYGFDFNKNQNIINDNIINNLSLIKFTDFKEKGKQRLDIKEFGLKGYFKQFIPSTNYNYSYKITLNGDIGTKIYQQLLLNSLSSKNFDTFYQEEKLIQNKLELDSKYIDDGKSIVEDLIKNSTVKQVNSYITINKDGKLIDMNTEFKIVYKNKEVTEEMSLHMDVNYEDIDTLETLDKKIFYINAIKFEELSPRIKKDAYKEQKSAPIKENVGTIKDFENKGVKLQEIPSNNPNNVQPQENIPTIVDLNKPPVVNQ